MWGTCCRVSSLPSYPIVIRGRACCTVKYHGGSDIVQPLRTKISNRTSRFLPRSRSPTVRSELVLVRHLDQHYHRHHHCTSNIIITIIIERQELVLLRHLDDASTSVELLTECASWFWVGRQSRWFSMGRSSRTPEMICHHHHHHHLTAISLIFYGGTLSLNPQPQSDSSLLQQQATTLSSKRPVSKGECLIILPSSVCSYICLHGQNRRLSSLPVLQSVGPGEYPFAYYFKLSFW